MGSIIDSAGVRADGRDISPAVEDIFSSTA